MTTGDVGVVWRRRDDVLWRRTANAAVLLPVDAEEPTSLVGTGALVWDLLAEPATLGDLVTALRAVFDGDPSIIEHDVDALLVRLAEMRAIEECG